MADFRRWCLVCTAFLLMGADADRLPMPGIGPHDPRVVVDQNAAPWRAIGRVQTEFGGRCTGFLIAPRSVLTAAHCIYRRRSQHFLQPGSVHFVIGYARGSFTSHARVVRMNISPGYDPAHEMATAGIDWALLTLDTALGTQDRILRLFEAPMAIGSPVVLGGYEKDREEVMEADLHCAVIGWTGDGANEDLMHHDCNATSGSSGAPVLARDADGRWIVVGLQILAVVGRAEGLAVPSYAIKFNHLIQP